ncbi:MAG: hypothetical protein ABMA64_29455 [Myxococcota bacterium]
MIVFGTRKFGWVDQIEGLGIVATTFFHVMFVPLVPLSTHLMIDDSRGLPLPMSAKSVAVAWFRSALFWSALASWVGVPATFGLSCVTAVPLTLGWLVTPWFVRKASPQRESEIRTALTGPDRRV